jgi:hypothetical protein
MSKKTFNPKDWASPNKTANIAAKPPVCTNPKTDIETITARIEAVAVDIAPITPIGAIWALPSLTLWAKAGAITTTV